MPVKRKKASTSFLFQTDAIVKGRLIPIDADLTGHRLYYDHPNGKLYQGDCVDWLASLAADSVDLVFADPPYNIKKAAWDTFESQEAYVEWSLRWIKQAARVVKPSGSMFVCGFSETLADL
ncbi:MAG TPA: DNA methyltransferase, partial [Pirellulales bacterium]